MSKTYSTPISAPKNDVQYVYAIIPKMQLPIQSHGTYVLSRCKRLCTLELAYLKDITSTRTLKGVFTMSIL